MKTHLRQVGRGDEQGRSARVRSKSKGIARDLYLLIHVTASHRVLHAKLGPGSGVTDALSGQPCPQEAARCVAEARTFRGQRAGVKRRQRMGLSLQVEEGRDYWKPVTSWPGW